MNGVFGSAAAPPLLLPGQSSISVLSSFVKALSLSIALAPVSLPAPPVANLYSQLISLIRQPNWQKHPSLRKLTPTISPSHFSSFLSHRPNLSPQIALNLFYFLTLAPSFKPNVQTYASLLRILIKNKAFVDDEKIQVLVVESCEAEEDARLEFSIFRELNCGDGGKFRFRISIRCYNMLLMSLARFVMIMRMKSVYRGMLEDEVSPNLYTFNTMINAYCKLGNVREAKHYLSMILKAGSKPDAHTFTSFILGH